MTDERPSEELPADRVAPRSPRATAFGRRAVATLLVPVEVVGGMRAVLERDFLVFTSHPRFLVLRTLIVVLTVAVIGVVLMVSQNEVEEERGSALFFAGTVLLPALLVLLSPAVSAPAIAGERSLDTLSLVLAAPVRPLSFVLAKFVSRVGVVLVLFFATLPVVAVSLLYGGVSGDLLLDFILVGVGIALSGTAAGIVASAFSRRVSTALYAAYGLGLFIPALLSPALFALAVVGRATFWAAIPKWLPLNPVGAWWVLMMESTPFGGGTPTFDIGTTWLAVASGHAVIAIALSTWRIAREGKFASRTGRKGRRVVPARFTDPVFDRMMRGSLWFRPRWGAWVLLLAIVAVQALWLAIGWDDWDEEWVHLITLPLCSTVVLFAVLNRASQSVARERQTQSLDLLLVSPSGRTLLGGKARGIVIGALPYLLLPALQGGLAALYSDVKPGAWAAWVASTSVLVILCSLIGLRFSCTSSTATRAALKSFGLFFGFIICHLVFMALVHGFMGLDDEFAIPLWGANPGHLLIAPMVILQDRSLNSDEWLNLISAAVWSGIWLFLGYLMWVRLPRTLRTSLDRGG